MATTELQDCNVIAEAFERGAVYEPSEAAVYAVMSRNVYNTRSFARGAQKVLSGYKVQSVLALKDKTAGLPDEATFAGLKLKNQYVAIPSSSAGKILARAVKECIPCNFRILSTVDINIGKLLMDALKADVKARLGALNAIADLFSNVDVYGDYCQMVGFLNFMCVPDLQRILAILAAMLMDFGSGLLNLNGLLQTLIAPFFTPVLLSLQALLDKFVQLVLSPLNCIMNAIQENIRKVNLQAITGDQTLTNVSKNLALKQRQVNIDVQKFQGQTRSGLIELHNMLNEGNALIRNKLDFYFKQLDKMLKTWSLQDLNYVALSNRKLIIVRLIGLIKAMIKARSHGASLCEDNAKPSSSELDIFFGTFVSPTSPFNISIDRDGNLRIEEKNNTPVTANTKTVQATNLLTAFQPVSKVFKCAIATTAADVDKVNRWIAELNEV